jgi:KAP family P-loop domain
MWADNETTVDLLGFDYLVDSLDVLLTQPGLLPLTVGVLGDWGSGKTSLLQMTQQRLDGDEGYITVFFSPWRYEDYEDVEGALIDTILSRLEHGIPDEEEDRRKQLRRLRQMAKRLGTGTVGALKVVVRPALSFVAQHYGATPEVAAVAGETAAAAVEAATTSAESGGSVEPQGPGKVAFMQPAAVLACAADHGRGDGWRRRYSCGRPGAGR